MASATVNAGTVNPLSANGLFRTVAISNILLPQGTNYVVGAVFSNGSGDQQATNIVSLTTPSQISFVGGRFANNGSTNLSFPITTLGLPIPLTTSNGIPGGSFEFVPVTAVPFEFSPTLGLSVLGGLWVGSRLIKKVKASKKSD